MKKHIVIMGVVFFVTLTASFAQEQQTKRKFGIGYGASMIGLWMLDLNIKGDITDNYSIESAIGFGMDGPSYEDGRSYKGIALRGMRDFKKGKRLNFYGYALGWYLIGSKETPPKSERFMGFGMGLGTEAWNGYFAEIGYIKMDYSSSVTLHAGKHNYF